MNYEVNSVRTYKSQLRGIERIHLFPGETQTANFILHPNDLALLDKPMNLTVEPGAFTVMVGNSSNRRISVLG